jgi:hypothetical protein
MNYLSAGKWWVVLPLYVVGGLTLGLADHQLGRCVQQLGMRPGLATAASVNIVLPLLAVGLAVACPRLGTAWLGAVALTSAFVLGLSFVYPPAHGWDPVAVVRSVPPVLVMACLGYAILGTVSVLCARGMGRHSFRPSTRAG